MEMTVLLEEDDGSLFSMEIGSSDTILKLKQNIRDYTRIPTTHQILSFQGIVLDDTRIVASYSIVAYSVIQLTIVNPFYNQGGATRSVQLLVTAPCSTVPTMQQADLTESVLQLKERLQKRLGIPPHVLGVSMSPKHHELLDAKCLYDYGLTDGCHIYIFTKVGSSSSSESEASANNQSEAPLNAEVDPTDKKSRHPPARLGAHWDSRHEDAGCQVFSDCRLKDGASVSVFLKPLQTQSVSASSDSSKLKI